VRPRTRDADLRALHRDDDLRTVGMDVDESEPDEKADDVPSDDVSAGPAMSKPEATVEPRSTSLGARVRLAGLSALATLLIVLATAGAAAWLGYMRVEFMPAQTAAQAPAPAKSNPLLASTPAVPPPQTNAASTTARNMIDGVPDIVADLPAVAALKKVDPDAYAKFVKRFAATYKADAADDEALTLARTALRKSIKPLLAKAATESLLEITEVNLAYMRALQPVNPGSCVALSDENKGATLDANLARDNAPLFQREMAVLERVINNAGSNEPAPTESEVKPYLQSVFDTLQKQQAQTALLSRGKLTPAEYGPYCNLVVAFYEAVRALPFADAVKLLRNLYAAAAAEPDTDTP
jgi:hypothetical protein